MRLPKTLHVEGVSLDWTSKLKFESLVERKPQLATFRSVFHFELIFVYSEKRIMSFFCMWILNCHNMFY